MMFSCADLLGAYNFVVYGDSDQVPTQRALDFDLRLALVFDVKEPAVPAYWAWDFSLSHGDSSFRSSFWLFLLR